MGRLLANVQSPNDCSHGSVLAGLVNVSEEMEPGGRKFSSVGGTPSRGKKFHRVRRVAGNSAVFAVSEEIPPRPQGRWKIRRMRCVFGNSAASPLTSTLIPFLKVPFH